MTDFVDVFQVLNESKDCDLEVLKSKCQKLLKEHHPDKNNGQESDLFLKAMQAWKILNDSSAFLKNKAHNISKNKANWDTVNLKDMSEDENCYTIDCRCGDTYNLLKSEISEDCDEELSLECDSCSNTINIIL